MSTGLAITEEHLELAATARRWVQSRGVLGTARTVLEAGAGADERPPWWGDLADLGWIGLAVSEANGGQGYGLPELAVVLEETGRAVMPGPFLTTAVTAVALDRWGHDPDLVRRLVAGDATAAVAPAPRPDGGDEVLAWCATNAEVVLVASTDFGSTTWSVVDVASATPRPSFDATRPLASVPVSTGDVPPGRALGDAPIGHLVHVLAAAEALGVAQWCVDAAAEHARTRVQFGRPIGQFQAVKHRCADMLARTELARAAVWDAVRALDHLEPGWQVAVHAAEALATDTAFRAAEGCIQVLGGIGYTWEHDAHLFLKRATAVRHLLPAPSVPRRAAARELTAGTARSLAFDLPAEAESVRDEVQAFVADLVARPKSDWSAHLADSGYLVPHWPRPWGLDATPIQQLVIDQELRAAGVRRRHLQVAGWVLPTIIGHGSAEQQERFVPASLRGEIAWCQMFSEPDAGSDLASLTTRAQRVDGGWAITGQKVWTTLAHQAQWALCLARTDPTAPRHEGIGAFALDMATPGIEIRPLRELTGMALFNEVFLTDVFVPDDCVIGSPTAGWDAARTTLANERVSMSSGSSFGPGVAALAELMDRLDPDGTDTDARTRLGALAVDAHALAALGVRTTLRALSGGQPGPEASIRKLLGVEHEQAVQEAGLAALGPRAAVLEGDGATWTAGYLGNRALSIAGGTSEIQRNLIAERLLHLPKDP